MKKKSSQILSKKTYLDILQFKPEMLKSISGRYLSNVRLLVLLLAILLIGGIGSYFSLPRTLNPEVKIPLVVISTILPGAGPSDIESLITIPLEKEIKKVKGLTSYNSSSQENASVIIAEFTADTDPKDARDEVRAAVAGVSDLPDDAMEPQVNDLDFEDVPVWQFAVMGKNEQVDRASLIKLSKKIAEELENINDIDRVEVSGSEQQQVFVSFDPTTVAEYGVNPLSLSQAISSALSAYPAGNVQTGQLVYSVSIKQPVSTLAELRDLRIEVEGRSFQLGDLATVAKMPEPGSYPTVIATKKGVEPAIILTVYKTREARIDVTKKKATQAAEALQKQYQENFELKTITDYAGMIDEQFANLGSNFVQTLILVFFSMFMLYGIRQASIAAIAIPFSLLVVFAAMTIFGLSLNFLSIFSLLIALGLFVDNAVVIIEAYTSYYQTGKFSPLETAILVWQDFFVELFSINLLTIWAFLPLLITSGIIGEFIKPLPIIVSAAMMGSVAVAVLFTLPAMMILSQFKVPARVKIFAGGASVAAILLGILWFLPKTYLLLPTILVLIIAFWFVFRLRREFWDSILNFLRKRSNIKIVAKWLKRAVDSGFISLKPLSTEYRKLVTKLLSEKKLRIQVLVVIAIFSIFSYLLLPLGLVVNEFFPKSDQDEISVELELPVGTRQEITYTESLKVIDSLKNIEDVDFVSLQLGRAVSSGFDIAANGPHKAVFTVVLKDEEERQNDSIKISQQIRDTWQDYSKGEIRVVEGSSGPPAGADIEVSILGSNLDSLQEYADQVVTFLDNLEGATNVSKSVESGSTQLVFLPNKNQLSAYKISEGQIGMWLRTLISGFNLGDMTLDDDDYDVVMRLNEGNVVVESVSLLQIPNSKGEDVSLSELGDLTLEPNPTVIERQDGQRTIKISAAALSGYIPTQLYDEFKTWADSELQMNDGYSWEVGGVNEENQKSSQSIINAMGISAILIFVTMVVQLGSFRKALIVMLVIPLATSGVFIWFALTGTPLSFPALVGMLALFGIVIANSLMIVDKVTQNTEAGLSMKDAIIDASGSRLEPIVLTTASQVIGLIPITLSDPIWRGLGGAIMAGMSFSGLIMLFFIPVVYYYFFPEKRS